MITEQERCINPHREGSNQGRNMAEKFRIPGGLSIHVLKQGDIEARQVATIVFHP